MLIASSLQAANRSSRILSKMRLKSGSGARHMVRYVSRKGSQLPLKLQYFPNFNEFTHKSTPSKMTDDNVHALEGFASGSCHRPQADNTMHDTRQYDDLQLDWILPADLKIASAHRQDALLVDCGDCRERNLQKLTPPPSFLCGSFRGAAHRIRWHHRDGICR